MSEEDISVSMGAEDNGTGTATAKAAGSPGSITTGGLLFLLLNCAFLCSNASSRFASYT